MGGLGKSTLASRLLERMPTHQRVVFFGRVDQAKLREQFNLIDYPDLTDAAKATEILEQVEVDLATRMRYLFNGPLSKVPCMFVLDDFEQGNLDERADSHVLAPDMAEILPALLGAIRATNSPSRVIITTRYEFPVPAGTRLAWVGLLTLTDVELTKKVAALAHLSPTAPTDDTIRQRAIEVASGNPRLLEWLDRIVGDTSLDADSLITAIENEADRFRREDLLVEKLLETQPVELRTMLARLNVVELPVPEATIHAVHDHPDASQHIRRAIQLGLIEQGTDPETGEHRHFVSNVLRPLIRPLLTEAQYIDACAAAAHSLYEIWVSPPSPDADES